MREQKERKRKNGLAIRIAPVAAHAPTHAQGRLFAASLVPRGMPEPSCAVVAPVARISAAYQRCSCRCGLLSKQEF